MVEMLKARVESFEFFANEFIKNAAVYERLTQLSDLCPVVPRVAEHILQRLEGETGRQVRLDSQHNNSFFFYECKKRRKCCPSKNMIKI